MVRKLLSLSIILLALGMSAFIVNKKFDSATSPDSGVSLHFYSNKSEEVRTILSYKYVDVLKVPVDASKILVEHYFSTYDRSNSYYIWAYVALETPLTSVSVYQIVGPRFDLATRQSDEGSRFGPAICSMKEVTNADLAKVVVEETFGVIVEPDETALGARIVPENDWPYSRAAAGDSVWSLTEEYLTSHLGSHFTDAPLYERIQTIDWLKDKVVIEPGPHNIETPELVRRGQGLAADFLLGDFAECFWRIIDQNGNEFIINKEGEVGRPSDFPQFQLKNNL
ncbi:MAG: hypothetical protein AAB460_03160 [Patescibacteria group bacterium]